MEELEGFLLFTYLKNILKIAEEFLPQERDHEPDEKEKAIIQIYWDLNYLVRRLDTKFYRVEG